MKLPEAIERELQSVERELDRRVRDIGGQMAGPSRLRGLRSAIESSLHGSEAGPQPHTWHGLMAGFAPRTEKPFLTNTTNSGDVGGPTNP